MTIWQMCIRTAITFRDAYACPNRRSKNIRQEVRLRHYYCDHSWRGARERNRWRHSLARQNGCRCHPCHHSPDPWLVMYKNRFAETLIKGQRSGLYADGKIVRRNLERASLSENDLCESLRLEAKQDKLDSIKTAFIETNGRISFILKKKN